MNMQRIVDLLFEALMLNRIPRSGYSFLGAGKESVAEHSFSTAFIAFVLAKLDPKVDAARLMAMCLVHDLPEARLGDLNYVQKQYVTADETRALAHAVDGLPFGPDIQALVTEFNAGESREARLARDADQLSLALHLKALQDIGHTSPAKWIPHVQNRLKTATGKKVMASILTRDRDSWWLEHYEDNNVTKRADHHDD
jgi:putative hydrolase of HD superfamily